MRARPRWPGERAAGRPPRSRARPDRGVRGADRAHQALRAGPGVLARRRRQRVRQGRRRPVHQAQRRGAGDARCRGPVAARDRAAAAPPPGRWPARHRGRAGPRGRDRPNGPAAGPRRPPAVGRAAVPRVPAPAAGPAHASRPAQLGHLRGRRRRARRTPVRGPRSLGAVHEPRPAAGARDRRRASRRRGTDRSAGPGGHADAEPRTDRRRGHRRRDRGAVRLARLGRARGARRRAGTGHGRGRRREREREHHPGRTGDGHGRARIRTHAGAGGRHRAHPAGPARRGFRPQGRDVRRRPACRPLHRDARGSRAGHHRPAHARPDRVCRLGAAAAGRARRRAGG